MHQSIKLFLSKKNQSRWIDRQNKRVLLNVEDYCSLLEKPLTLVQKVNGIDVERDALLTTKIYADLASGGGIAVAQVSGKTFTPLHRNTCISNSMSDLDIFVVTYYDLGGEIVTLNRLDFRSYCNHENYYTIFKNKTERKLYEKYFTDYKKQNGIERYFAKTPHFHFNTRTQSSALKKDSRSNAISFDGLTKYLKDLEYCNEDNPLMQFSLGMPFIKFKTGQLDYQSQIKQALEGLQNSENTSKPMKKSLENLILIKMSCGKETALTTVLTDLFIVKEVYNLAEKKNFDVESVYVLERIGCSFMGSISNLNYQKITTKEEKTK